MPFKHDKSTQQKYDENFPDQVVFMNGVFIPIVTPRGFDSKWIIVSHFQLFNSLGI